MQSRLPAKSVLFELLEELVSVPPEESGRCHYCLAETNWPHEDGCSWVAATIVVTGEETFSPLVGEDPETYSERIDEEDPLPVEEFVADEAEKARLELDELLSSSLAIVVEPRYPKVPSF